MLDVKDIIKKMYLKLYLSGYNKISLRDEDLDSYVPFIEDLIESEHIYTDDLFIKVDNSYVNYKSFLIKMFLCNTIGYMNESHDAIILRPNYFYTYNELQRIDIYGDLIDRCCNTLLSYYSNNEHYSLRKIIS